MMGAPRRGPRQRRRRRPEAGRSGQRPASPRSRAARCCSASASTRPYASTSSWGTGSTRSPWRRTGSSWWTSVGHELQCVVLCAFPECKVRSFGSTQNGFSTYDSDLDATLTQQGVKQVEAKYAAAVLQQYLLPLLAKSGRFEIAGTIAEARIPILKLRYWGNQLEVLDVDLSCHNTEAFPNTQLLLAYSRMGEGIIAALGILVKLWAKSAGVSGAPQKHLSSYSIILMVLYFLQVVHNVPCLPTWAFDGSTEVPPEGRQHWKWTGPMTLLLWEFFKFYAMDFQWGTERTVNSDERHKDLRGRWASRLHVEDPNGQLPVGLTPVSCELAPAPRDPPGAGAAWHGVPRGPGVQMFWLILRSGIV
ncbi:unnamed protein product [Prorocentrum cordatum]|uniref:Poly(A) RNA polymerase mitochondrial-like central palm domain-containing protein n=1 Tax=Prorocentrum cordatum TaxID=2364126 RepID=A0ABN9VZC9_9DINO|nr:unnamed protein product [Polarella glacialis]